jgi:tetratricopeptide (TPR) repeat protein
MGNKRIRKRAYNKKTGGVPRKKSFLTKGEVCSIVLGVVAIVTPIGYSNYSESRLVRRIIEYSKILNLNEKPAEKGRIVSLHPYAEGLKALNERRLDDAEIMIRKALVNADDDSERSVIRSALSRVYFEKGEYRNAREECLVSLSLALAANDQRSRIWALNNLGLIELKTGDFEDSKRLFAEGLTLANITHNDDCSAVILNNLGILTDYHGDYVGALSLFEKALLINRRTGNQYGIAVNLHNMGTFYQNVKHDYEEALKVYSEAAAIFERLDVPVEEIDNLICIGLTYYDKGEPDKALPNFYLAFNISNSIKYTRRANLIKSNIARCELRLKNRKTPVY